MSDYDSIIQDALRTRYGVVIDDNFDNVQIACDYLSTLPETSILVFAWHRPKDLRLQSAAWENGLTIVDLLHQDEGTMLLAKWSHDARSFPFAKKHLMLEAMDTLIAWYHKKPKSTKSIISLAKKIGLSVIENPTMPSQLRLL